MKKFILIVFFSFLTTTLFASDIPNLPEKLNPVILENEDNFGPAGQVSKYDNMLFFNLGVIEDNQIGADTCLALENLVKKAASQEIKGIDVFNVGFDVKIKYGSLEKWFFIVNSIGLSEDRKLKLLLIVFPKDFLRNIIPVEPYRAVQNYNKQKSISADCIDFIKFELGRTES